MRRLRPVALVLALLAAGWRLAPRLIGRRLVARTERRLCGLTGGGSPRVSARSEELHRTLLVADLHADSLLWGRDLLVRADRGHVDVPRLIEGRVALQVLAVSAKVPRHLNLESNGDGSDDVLLLALASGWPVATLRSLLARARHLARKAQAMADRSGGTFSIIRSGPDLATYLERRRADPALTAALLSVEGAHALDGNPANVDVLADAGFRMMSPTHFFDNGFGGSAHGIAKTGLTDAGREMVRRMEARSMLADISHAAVRTIDDVLAMARRPVVASHTGVNGTCESVRNLSDEHLRGIAATGGLVGIGFWPTATCGDDPGSIARAAVHAIGVAGVDHVGLGSDFDGGVCTPFDASGMVQLTDALLAEGLSDADVGAVMGGNVLRLLGEALPAD